MRQRFDADILRRLRRIDRALTHHDGSLRSLAKWSEASDLNRSVFLLLERRMTRLRSETKTVELDRTALLHELSSLGLRLEESDAKIGRWLRMILGHSRPTK